MKRSALLWFATFFQFTVPAFAQHVDEGPSGGSGGESCAFKANRFNVEQLKLSSIVVHSGAWIDRVDLRYSTTLSPDDYVFQCGGLGGFANPPFSVYGGYYIAKVSGHHRDYVLDIQILLKNKTDNTIRQASYGTFALDSRSFSYEAPPGKAIVGLFFNSGIYVDALGVVMGDLN